MADGFRTYLVGTVEARMAQGGRMTDHADLIARLRHGVAHAFNGAPMKDAAASALESLAQECAKLRKERDALAQESEGFILLLQAERDAAIREREDMREMLKQLWAHEDHDGWMDDFRNRVDAALKDAP